MSGLLDRAGLPLGIQVHVLDLHVRRDLDGTFASLAAIGFGTLELAGFYGHSPQALRAAADRHGLRITGIHLRPSPFRDAPTLNDPFPDLADALTTLGVRDVTLAHMLWPRIVTRGTGEPFEPFMARVAEAMDEGEWRRTAEYLNAQAARFAGLGLRFGYHNYNLEFAEAEWGNGYEILMTQTDPALVDFELDVGWAAAGGADPLALFAQHGSRIRQIHVKDIGPKTVINFAAQQDAVDLGDGILVWSAILPAAIAAGTREVYLERDGPAEGDLFAQLRTSAALIRTVQ